MTVIEVVRPSRRPAPASRRRVRDRVVVTSDGVRLSARQYGPDTAPHTVVLLHGLCLDQDSWALQVAELTGRCGATVRIITYDHRGHGNSAGAPMHTYRIERLAEDLADVLAALRVTGRVTLAGHSMGGMAALAYLGRPAHRRPVDPEHLVLVGTAAGKVTERGIGRLLATRAIDVAYGLVQHGPRAATDAAVRAVVQPLCGALTRYGGYGAAARDALVAVSAGSINATPLPTKVGFLRGLKDHDQYRVLGTITAQTTVISGGADKLIPPAHAHELVAAIPGARHLHHPRAGHMLLHEVPGVVSEALGGDIAALVTAS
ncbi:alpha/beta fold hydrolase [Mycobacterium talmoniae]|uniref:Alpha/beta hydrolase n=1 Tax=Mycobacterium talmoniae TaxID=1858794 RepID=A0A1S1NAK7_9MYCO|nr:MULTISPECIES: alpha/beta hydrolase [Mycobacterium]OHU97082.1 alpha/beta hydrolase [Mycobacterium talmoniae]TDH57274.1 alpha/beta hydrolase [Mycobacterium eburneum]